MNPYDRIKELYDTLPGIDCQQRCGYCCKGIKLTPVENRAVQRATGQGFPNIDKVIAHGGDPTCVFLDRAEGNCTIYTLRPLICRLWGLTESMPCPEGCQPERVVSDREAYALMTEANYIGGLCSTEDYLMYKKFTDDDEVFPHIQRTMRGEITWRQLSGIVWDIEHKRGNR